MDRDRVNEDEPRPQTHSRPVAAALLSAFRSSVEDGCSRKVRMFSLIDLSSANLKRSTPAKASETVAVPVAVAENARGMRQNAPILDSVMHEAKLNT